MNDYAHIHWIKLGFKLERMCVKKVLKSVSEGGKKSGHGNKKHSKEQFTRA